MSRITIPFRRSFPAASPAVSPAVSPATVAAALALALVAFFWSASALHADTIPVTGACTLPNAIHAANTDSAVGGCAPGSGSDTLVLDANALYQLNVVDNTFGGNNGLPVITTTLTISGNGATIARNLSFSCPDPVNPNFRLFQVDDTGNLTLQQVTLRNGCANTSGGAVNNPGGIVTIENSAIYGNRAEGQGGALSNSVGTMTLIDTAVYLNLSETGGGGILNTIGAMTLQGSDVYSNSTGGFGGGIMNSLSSITMTNSSLYANTTPSGGGGLYSTGGEMTIEGSEVYSNSTSVGGGLYVTDDIVNVTGSLVYSNTADEGGGAYIASPNATLIDSDFYFNQASLGGGLFHRAGTLTLENADVFSNTADSNGGGIVNLDGALTVIGSSVYSNVANMNGGGIHNEVDGGSATITVTQASRIEFNHAGLRGGGLHNQNGEVTIAESSVTSNRADQAGGGIANSFADGTVTITAGSEIAANRADSTGGGVYNDIGHVVVQNSAVHSNMAGTGAGLHGDNGTIMVQDSEVFANIALNNGGGLYVRTFIPPLAAEADGESALATFGGVVELEGSRVYSNTAERGGGLYNDASTVTIQSSALYSNTANSGGGGLINRDGRVTIRGSDVLSNSAVIAGGIANVNADAVMTVTENSRVEGNKAGQNGAGLYNMGGALTVSESAIHANRAGALGGGVFVTGTGIVTITQSTLLRNLAGNDGGALHQAQGRSAIIQSCIVGNSDRAVVYGNGVSPLIATENWWGAADGPSGSGPGSGDAVSNSVDFSSFLETPILDCPSLEPDLALEKVATPGVWKPGQTIVYRLRFINTGNKAAQSMALTDTIPGLLSATDISADLPITPTNPAPTLVWQIADLPPGESGTLTVTAVVSPLLTADATLANTASIAAADEVNLSDNTASVSRNVQLPRVHFSSANYSIDENGGAVTITVELDEANPHAAVTVDYATGGGSAVPNVDYTPKSGTLTIPAGQSSASFTVDVTNDDDVEPDKSVGLTLSNAVGAVVDSPGSATLTILDDDRTVNIDAVSADKDEGNSGSTPFTFEVTREGDLSAALTVNYAVSGPVNGIVNGIVDGSDFVGDSLPTGALSFAPNQDTLPLTINVQGDVVAELDEAFTVTLTMTSGNAQIVVDTAQGVIRNDDEGVVEIPLYMPIISTKE